MTLVHLPASATVQEAAAAVREHGCVIVDRLAAVEDLDRIDDELASRYATASFGDGEISGTRTTRVGCLIARSPTARKLIMNDLVRGVISDLMPDPFQIGLTEMISLSPGAQAQFIHRDEGVHGSYPFQNDYELMVSTLWAASDYTDDMGATRVIPGSHRLRSDLKFVQADTVAAEMPRGSVLIYSGKIYHGGGENRSQKIRRALNVDFIACWLRQMENQYLSCPPDIARTLPADLLKLMGYDITPRAAGRVGDWIEPLSFLMGEPKRLNEAMLKPTKYQRRDVMSGPDQDSPSPAGV